MKCENVPVKERGCDKENHFNKPDNRHEVEKKFTVAAFLQNFSEMNTECTVLYMFGKEDDNGPGDGPDNNNYVQYFICFEISGVAGFVKPFT